LFQPSNDDSDSMIYVVGELFLVLMKLFTTAAMTVVIIKLSK